jgi:putative nucleotidyltransferase with HDIG domain
MRDVNLLDIFTHPIAQKYLNRSGLAHAIAVAYHAFHLANEYNVDPDIAAKAGLLHDMGHFTWYRNGKWDYDLYKQNDIHPIKGAERAHKLLIRLGETRSRQRPFPSPFYFILIRSYLRMILFVHRFSKSSNGLMKKMKKKAENTIIVKLIFHGQRKAS